MPTNQLLPFGTGGGANVLDYASYQALAARLTGFTAGTAVSAQLNAVWRQAAFAAAMIGQFTADNSGQDVLDDGDVPTFEDNFMAALRKLSLRGAGVVYDAPGTYSFTVPDGVRQLDVELIGGGGGGGAAGGTAGRGAGGAASGGYARKTIACTPGQVFSLTVGAGGVGATVNDGGNGGTSSFGGIFSATGANGASNTGSTSPTGGVGIGGDVNYTGSGGSQGFAFGASPLGGAGAPAPIFGGGASESFGAGYPGLSYGSGGGGAGSVPNNGGAGHAGAVIIRY